MAGMGASLGWQGQHHVVALFRGVAGLGLGGGRGGVFPSHHSTEAKLTHRGST